MRIEMPPGTLPASRPQKLKGALAQQAARYGVQAGLFAAALFLAGCQSFGQKNDITGSIPNDTSLSASQQGLFHYTEELGARYDSNPKDKRVALAYAHALQKSTRYAQAVAVLQRLAATYPNDREILGAYGKALVEAGRLQQAADVLPQAHTPENPNWTILSAQGTVADQMGDHQRAQEYYHAALKIVPNQPDVLSNLGLSYALSKQLPLAESTLELAAAQPTARARVRQNLALVLALEGKFEQAQKIAQHDLTPLQAAENVASIRQMIAQTNPWKEISRLDARPSKRMAARKNTMRKVALRGHHPKPAKVASDQPLPAALH
jgi:Flp pilus assembly protein TadD